MGALPERHDRAPAPAGKSGCAELAPYGRSSPPPGHLFAPVDGVPAPDEGKRSRDADAGVSVESQETGPEDRTRDRVGTEDPSLSGSGPSRAWGFRRGRSSPPAIDRKGFARPARGYRVPRRKSTLATRPGRKEKVGGRRFAPPAPSVGHRGTPPVPRLTVKRSDTRRRRARRRRLQ